MKKKGVDEKHGECERNYRGSVKGGNVHKSTLPIKKNMHRASETCADGTDYLKKNPASIIVFRTFRARTRKRKSKSDQERDPTKESQIWNPCRKPREKPRKIAT